MHKGLRISVCLNFEFTDEHCMNYKIVFYSSRAETVCFIKVCIEIIISCRPKLERCYTETQKTSSEKVFFRTSFYKSDQ
jgi:hypothetical protein